MATRHRTLATSFVITISVAACSGDPGPEPEPPRNPPPIETSTAAPDPQPEPAPEKEPPQPPDAIPALDGRISVKDGKCTWESTGSEKPKAESREVTCPPVLSVPDGGNPLGSQYVFTTTEGCHVYKRRPSPKCPPPRRCNPPPPKRVKVDC